MPKTARGRLSPRRGAIERVVDHDDVAAPVALSPVEYRTATLSIPGTPPSLNKIGYHSHWSVGRKAKKDWEGFLHIALMEQKVPRKLGSVSASATLHFKQRRRRDEGNWRALLEKALGDVLQAAGYLEDDTPEYYRFGAVQLVAPSPEPLTLVHLDYR